MKITKMGSDYVCINELNMSDIELQNIPRIHLIKLAFKNPTLEKVEFVMKTFKSTNRFVIEDNIKFYNDILRSTNKKYYISNTENDKLITFFKRNNKVLLDTTKLGPLEKSFVFSVSLEDVLQNTEVIIIKQKYYKENPGPYNNWTGNLILI